MAKIKKAWGLRKINMSRKQQREISKANRDDLVPVVMETKTLQQMLRKGHFLVKQFGNPQGPLLTPAAHLLAPAEHGSKKS